MAAPTSRPPLLPPPIASFFGEVTLLATSHSAAPILIRIETKAGHGAGKPTTKQIEEVADRWGFLARELKMGETSAQAVGGSK
jgi:prolyl oligopeptidase